MRARPGNNDQYKLKKTIYREEVLAGQRPLPRTKTPPETEILAGDALPENEDIFRGGNPATGQQIIN